eukprot:GHVP01016641.1.p4 GENE.GHVP01016641.1~~GHVP01016641.1.p4  ORF type:complete len:115 (+),score=20.31 GHVP01016641.1:1165-1509(+)
MGPSATEFRHASLPSQWKSKLPWKKTKKLTKCSHLHFSKFLQRPRFLQLKTSRILLLDLMVPVTIFELDLLCIPPSDSQLCFGSISPDLVVTTVPTEQSAEFESIVGGQALPRP